MRILNLIVFSLFSMIFTQASYAADSKNEEQYLIPGSSREEGHVNMWWKCIVGNETDFTHKKTYGGKATTLDLKLSAIPDLPHIQADARTYNPGSRCIRAAFMELFPSIVIHELGMTKDTGSNPEKILENMRLMPDVIRNLSRSMLPGSHLEIEHVPHFTLLDPNGYVNIVMPFLRKENPFHHFISPLFMENLKSRKFRGAPAKIEHWDQVKAQKRSQGQGWTEENANAIIAEAAESHPTLLQALKNIQQLIKFDESSFNMRVNAEIANYEKDANKFYLSFHNTLSSVIAQEFCLLSQNESVKEFLEKTDFKNVTSGHQDNIHNGRKQVWMISAFIK